LGKRIGGGAGKGRSQGLEVGGIKRDDSKQ
jgi:hypothetical protein